MSTPAKLESTARGPAAGPPRDLDRTTDASDATLGETTAARRSVDQSPWDPAAAEPLARGAAIGRYVALDRLGAGAMGVVFAAFDPELDRKVAIKLLQPDLAGPDARARLLREAQALARLSHPNVVAVFDVGTRGDQVWIAMELVTGRTLREWFAERPRDWRDALEVMRAVGRGLAAAHAAGLVHRDVKPDNVMIAADGRVRVMDFGLARGRDDAGGAGPGARAMLGVEVTQAGSLIGTPAYMAPEQFRGEAVGPQADVFAFCVMLWEAIHGARPFAGETLEALRGNVLAGRLAAAAPRPAPRWLDAVVLRGLAADPGQRWPNLDAVLAELDRGQASTRRRGAALLAGGLLAGVGAVALGAWSWRRAEHEARVAACVALGDRVGEHWDDRARERLRGALAASASPFAAASAERALPWLDAWAAEWRRVRISACDLHEVQRTWSEDQRARADDCLDERMLEFTALVDELSSPGADVALRATEAAAGLTAATACGEPHELARRPALPDADHGRLHALRSSLARVRALARAGRFADGLAAARAALTDAEALDWPPATAEARLLVGQLAHRNGDNTAAVADLEAAYFEAARASADEVAVEAASLLLAIVGAELVRTEDGLRWGRHAELGLLALGGGGRTVRDGLLLNYRGNVHQAAGEFQAARDDHEAARSIFADALGPDHPLVAAADGNLAVDLSNLGDRERARETFARSLDLRIRALGPDHPDIGGLLNNFGTLTARTGDFAGALALYERALAIRARALGPDHPDVAESLGNIASAQFMLGRLDDVEASFSRVLAIHERIHGPDHPTVAETLSNLGFAQDAVGKHAEARQTLTRALAGFRRAFTGDHPRLALCLNNLGLVEAHLGDLAAAQRLHEEALAMRERLVPPGHPDIASSLRHLAHVAALRGDVARARALLETATPALRDDQLAEARFALARAWWDQSPRERPAARALAERARDGYDGPGKRPQRAAVEAWLATHALAP